MKKTFVLLLSFIVCASFCACAFNANGGEISSPQTDISDGSSLKPGETDLEPGSSGEPSDGEIAFSRAINAVSYDDKGVHDAVFTDGYLKKLSGFSSRLYSMAAEGESGNYAFSPISVYMALSVLHAVGDANVKADIEELFGMTGDDVAQTGKLFLNLTYEREYNGKIATKLRLTNSVWINSGTPANESALGYLAENLYCHAFSAPFYDNAAEANAALRKFIKEQTNGLIDKNFDLPPETVFAIVNTLYFKDLWDKEELPVSTRDFFNGVFNVKKTFLTGKYVYGRVAETENCNYFYARTFRGYKVKFILPKEGYSLSEVMTAENLNEINSREDFSGTDGFTDYFTRCIFPEYRIESDTPLKRILSENGYLTNAFHEYFSDLVSGGLCVSDIKHQVVLNVDKLGVEGAAVTIISNEATSVGPGNPAVHLDFVLDKNFGFLITSPSDVVLFAGQVVNP